MAYNESGMGLKIWNLVTDLFDHNVLANNFIALGQHNHTAGQGPQIPTAGIQDGAITGSKLAAGAITGALFQDGSIPAGKIVPGSITGAQIAAHTITGDLIGTGTINANNIANSTITSAQLSSDLIAQIGGGGGGGGSAGPNAVSMTASLGPRTIAYGNGQFTGTGTFINLFNVTHNLGVQPGFVIVQPALVRNPNGTISAWAGTFGQVAPADGVSFFMASSIPEFNGSQGVFVTGATYAYNWLVIG